MDASPDISIWAAAIICKMAIIVLIMIEEVTEMRKRIPFAGILALLFACVIGMSVSLAEDTNTSFLYGDYILYTMDYAGTQMDPGSMGMSSVLSLLEDGTGVLTMNGGDNPLPKWIQEGETITLYNEAGDALPCTIRSGIIALEMGENYLWYYAHESLPEAGNSEPSMLSEIFEKINAAEGAHMNYEFHSDYMDSTSIFDVHAKDSFYYARRETKVSGYDQISAVCFLNDTAYTLYPDKMTGKTATTVPLSALNNNVLMLDDLYGEMYKCAMRRDYNAETRSIDDIVYTAEVFPGSDYVPEVVFYYNDTGDLVHVLVGALKSAPDMGETFYTIHSIGTDFDASLFDISGYTIE